MQKLDHQELLHSLLEPEKGSLKVSLIYLPVPFLEMRWEVEGLCPTILPFNQCKHYCMTYYSMHDTQMKTNNLAVQC